eukprot:CAMPEP_0173402786 /NCGR_PEP_ID=MMETSP1356-20130122/54914_1 /TAXON_ID=77927 ORGANISM="Hemiselmis virescens, Strain PCC157" /NCGR_SAMPLE_ID=MMETSP1356 /ASSEMBLY_ACC=CAM_ASM_000847 /LENGTH=397 /DNA_ID=CAMNT_0014363183 /DNA_START=73 /DNA_END=1263 /DNA_ORIENTATION=+
MASAEEAPKGERTPLLASGSSKQKLAFIEGLRFVAVGWIVVYHYAAWTDSSVPEAVKRLITNFPLDLFTVVSGFVTHLAYANKDTSGGTLQFLGGRVQKLVLIYYLSSLLCLGIKLTNHAVEEKEDGGGGHGSKRLVNDLIAFVPDIFGINAWFSATSLLPVGAGGAVVSYLAETTMPTNAPLWYVQALAFCWVLYPTFKGLVKEHCAEQMGRVAVIAVCMWLLSMLPLCVYAVYPGGSQFQFLKVFPPFLVPSFLVGALACELHLQSQALSASSRPAVLSSQYAAIAAELLFVGYCVVVALVPLNGDLALHLWTLFWAGMLLLFSAAVAATEGYDGEAEQIQCGLKWVLDSEFLGLLGGVSLYVYALQRPLSILCHWCVDMTAGEPGWVHVQWMDW